jgi:hypothetical protein
MDGYTKAVLSVIAVCLFWLCVRPALVAAPAHASANGRLDVNIAEIGGFRLHQSAALPVEIDRLDELKGGCR